MRRPAIIIITMLALATLPAGAGASTGSVPGHSCRALEPQVLRLTAVGTSCSTARALERSQMHQDPEEGFTVSHRHWSWSIYSRAHGHTYELYSAVPGHVYVQLVWCCPAS